MPNYSESKVAQLLHFDATQDYLLPPVPLPPINRVPTPYYIAFRVFSMQPQELEQMGSAMGVSRLLNNEFNKKELIQHLCTEGGMGLDLSDWSSKRMKQSLMEISDPLMIALRARISGQTLTAMIDLIAQRYSPGSIDILQQGVKRIAATFQELYSQNKQYKIAIPKERQLVTFFSQIAERVFGETRDPLKMLVVACPRYGESDEYDRLEGGLSQTAGIYLSSLPLLTNVLTKNCVPFQGLMLINDTEEQMIDGSLLQRLGLTIETYRAKCRENVVATDQAIVQDSRITNVSVSLFTEAFPEFIGVTANIERQLFRLLQQDERLKLAMEEVANMRLERHRKIMGGVGDLSDSLYLALHYAAEYMALGYLCRSHFQLSNNSLIVNYNSPNVEQFNSQELLAKCMSGNIPAETINTIPVFQVKYY